MQKELLSAYIDGEYQDSSILEQVYQTEVLQQAWGNYHLVRSVIRNESNILLGMDFTQKIARRIEEEPQFDIIEEQPEPHVASSRLFLQKVTKWLTPLSQVAVAAGVCLVAVFGVQTYVQDQDNSGQPSHVIASPLQTLPTIQNIQQVSYSLPEKNTPTPAQLEQQNRRINIMLQNYELQRRINSSLEHSDRGNN